MSASKEPRKRLPENPSEENLRKQAKQLGKEESLQLAAAQRRLASEYGYRNWAELMRSVASRFVPVIPLRGLVAFPHEVYPIYIGRRKSIRAIDAADDPKNATPLGANKPILLVAQRDARITAPSPTDLYEIGTLGVIVERDRLPDGTVKIMVEGRKRARIKRFVFGQKFFKADAEEITEAPNRSARLESRMRSALSAFHSYTYGRRPNLREIADSIEKIDDPSIVSDKIARHMDIQLEDQQALLEAVGAAERLEKILGYLEAAS